MYLDLLQKEHNVMSKKVPKNSESCIIFAAGVDFLQKPLTVFVRLENSVVLEDFCEIPAPTKFLGLFLGPPDMETKLQEAGKALGIMMSDQVSQLCKFR
jgi:hypothetical protein